MIPPSPSRLDAEDRLAPHAPRTLVASPFLHVDRDKVYDPLTDRTLEGDDPAHAALRRVAEGGASVSDLAPEIAGRLAAEGWLVPEGEDLTSRFLLKYVSLEAHTVCNQACYFCPVSIAPRDDHFMPTEMYRNIVGQLAAWRETIEAVFMINYNEPTADPRFLEQVATIREAGLPPAVLTNGTGLTPKRVDALLAMGGLRFLSINLSSVDHARYRETRGKDHLAQVLRNLDYVKDEPVAQRMDMIVLGSGDEEHVREFEAISERFAGSRFTVTLHRVMDRAGLLQIGARPASPNKRLCGCDNVGSRPLQHLHITPHGKCVLCCEDYYEKYVVGDLSRETVAEVLTGRELAKYRRWIYGLEEAPDDFMCRKCIFARVRRR